jgi:hypothetical protein
VNQILSAVLHNFLTISAVHAIIILIVRWIMNIDQKSV